MDMLILSKLKSSLIDLIPDRLFLEYRYKVVFNKPLSLTNPITYNEKIQWLKLFDRNPEYINLVDKYAVKQIVAEKIGPEYVIPTLGVWKRYDDIAFDLLPDQFVLKCTHDSGSVVIVKNKSLLNHSEAKERLEKSLKENFYYRGREWPYKNVTPQIIAENYLEGDLLNGGLTDYKLFFFDGVCKAILAGQNRFSNHGLEMTYYDPKWNRLPFTKGADKTFYPSVKKPQQLDEMLELGTKLAQKYPHVRMDFYIVDDHIYFGEYTFYPSSGFLKFNPESWDTIFGNWIKLPTNRRNCGF